MSLRRKSVLSSPWSEQLRLRIRLAIFTLLILAALVVLVGLAVNAGPGGAAMGFGVHTLHVDDQGLRKVRDLGARYVVQVFSWSEIEPTRGEFHWEYTDWLLRAAEYYDLAVVARIDKPPEWASPSSAGLSAPPQRLGDYGDFVAQMAARYRGRIAGYVIWNEPNLALEWGNQHPDPAAYVAMLRAASDRIRAADPGARILSAGLAPTNENSDRAMDDRDYLRAMYAAGARGAFDILAAHPYGFGNPPDDPRGAHEGLNFARLEDLRDIMVQNGDAAKPVWITEFGYTTSPPPDSVEQRVTEEEQARFLVRAFEFARERWDWVQLFTVWNLSAEPVQQGNQLSQPGPQGLSGSGNSSQADATGQEGYSLVRRDGTFTPAYIALRAVPKETGMTSLVQAFAHLIARQTPSIEFLVLARDAQVHLGDSEYPAPWVPLYQNRNPSTDWQGDFYLRPEDLQGLSRVRPWTLSMELMQVNDYDSRVTVNGKPADPEYLPAGDFTSIWATVHFQVPASTLHEGSNTVTVNDGKVFPPFQQLGFTWDDFQLRNVLLTPP